VPNVDVIEEKLSYVGQRESYEVVAINGKAANGARHSDLRGAISAGEFGSLMRRIFLPTTKTTFTWKQMAKLQGRSVYVFAYSVPAEAGTRVKAALSNREIVASYGGLIYVEAETKVILRITVSVQLPRNFPIRAIRQIVDYTPVTIAGDSYSLPSHAEFRIRDESSEYINKIDFKNYHKFGTESTVLVGNLSAGSGIATANGQNSPQAEIAKDSVPETPAEIAETHSEPNPVSALPDPQPAAPVATVPAPEKPQSVAVAEPLTRPAAETAALSQPQPPAPHLEKPAVEADAPKEPFRLRVSTELAIVPVVVRDKKGQTVANLTRDDFQLFDKGKRREITSFTVEVQEENQAGESRAEGAARDAVANSPGVSVAPNFTLFLFDDRNLKAGELAQVKEAAARQIDRMQPTDRLAILTTSEVELSGFTAERNQLHEALKKLRLLPSSGSNAAQCPKMSYYMADLILKNWTPALQAATSDVMHCMLLTPDQVAPATRRAMMTAREVVANGEQESRNNLRTIKNAVQWISQMPGKRSIVLISPGFFLSSQLEVEAASVVDEAIRAEVAISALDARGLYTLSGSGEASGAALDPTNARIKFDISRDEAAVATNVMQEMAAGTGGDFVHNTNDLTDGLRQLATPPTCTYLLGFKPEDVKMDGSYHALKVQLNSKKNLDLQARRGYFALKR